MVIGSQRSKLFKHLSRDCPTVFVQLLITRMLPAGERRTSQRTWEKETIAQSLTIALLKYHSPLLFLFTSFHLEKKEKKNWQHPWRTFLYPGNMKKKLPTISWNFDYIYVHIKKICSLHLFYSIFQPLYLSGYRPPGGFNSLNEMYIGREGVEEKKIKVVSFLPPGVVRGLRWNYSS